MKRPKQLTERSRRLRRDATWPEKILWSGLRGEQLEGFKFRRQHPVLGHILDFACVSVKVAVEVDGASHSFGRDAADDRKEQVLREHGWEIVRFSNREINSNLNGSLVHILNVCKRRMSEGE